MYEKTVEKEKGVAIASASLFLCLFFSAAKDRLSDLTSREGDWFMDELCTMSGNVSQMVKTLEFCFSVSAGCAVSYLV